MTGSELGVKTKTFVNFNKFLNLFQVKKNRLFLNPPLVTLAKDHGKMVKLKETMVSDQLNKVCTSRDRFLR